MTLEQQVQQRLADLAPQQVAELMDGPCLVQGRVGQTVALEAPICGRRVAAYHVKIETYRTAEVRPFRKRPWRSAVDSARISPFQLVDGSGQASVAVTAPSIYVGGAVSKTSYVLPPRRVNRLLEQVGGSVCPVTWMQLLQNPDDRCVRWTERTLEAGAPVTVIGYSTRVPAAAESGESAESYRRAPAVRVEIRPPADGEMVVADRHLKALAKHLRHPGAAVLAVLS